MPSRRAIATIDIGTNTALLLVARAAEDAKDSMDGAPEVLENAAEVTRLGRGIGLDGALGREGIAATLAAVERYAALARKHDAEVFAVGTEALRRAPNAADFLGPAREVLGRDIEVIAGEREAELTFRAVAESFPRELAAGPCVIVDIGGGSTEIVQSVAGEAVSRRSIPLGSVRLTERHFRYDRHDPPSPAEADAVRADIAETIARSGALVGGSEADGDRSPGAPWTLIGVAGTVTSLAAMSLGLPTYDPERVHGARLSVAALETQLARLAVADQRARETIIGLDPKRADVIFAGALILHRIAELARADVIVVSDRGIRWGLYFERVAASWG
jgi:exopolyphosphatase/guanosine-5'-triphosphate,3'-diphosphate pyrophosphatase